MWRAILLRYLLRLRYTRDLIAQLEASRLLRRLCGFRDEVPDEGTFSRFYKRLTAHQDLVNAAIVEMAARVNAEIEAMQRDGGIPENIPVPGRTVAIDSSDVRAHGSSFSKADPNATWGHRTSKVSIEDKELFYGYKLHAVCDAYYGTPLAWQVLPANMSDSPTLPGLMDSIAADHPDLPVRYAIGDRGYDALSNFKDLDRRKIFAVIGVRDMAQDKTAVYTADGRPRCLSGEPMDYVRSERGKGHLFRCKAEGCHLKGDKPWLGRNCENEHYEGWDGELLRRIGRLPRASKRWARIYKQRTQVERMFGSLKRSRLLDTHWYLGIEKVRLHVGLSLLTYTATMLAPATGRRLRRCAGNEGRNARRQLDGACGGLTALGQPRAHLIPQFIQRLLDPRYLARVRFY